MFEPLKFYCNRFVLTVSKCLLKVWIERFPVPGTHEHLNTTQTIPHLFYRKDSPASFALAAGAGRVFLPFPI